MIMSVQSDVEILSVQALERYASQHNLSTPFRLLNVMPVSIIYPLQKLPSFSISTKYLKKFWYSMSICINLI